jgi:DNA-binding NarL/FixJ family response regulator
MNRGRRDFSDQDRALLSVLRAPLNAALLRARRRQQARQALTTMAGHWLAGLTEREIQILRLVADGRTNTAIAHALEISPRTVAKHLEHTYRKLGVNNRAAAVSHITMPEGPVKPAPPDD